MQGTAIPPSKQQRRMLRRMSEQRPIQPAEANCPTQLSHDPRSSGGLFKGQYFEALDSIDELERRFDQRNFRSCGYRGRLLVRVLGKSLVIIRDGLDTVSVVLL